MLKFVTLSYLMIITSCGQELNNMRPASQRLQQPAINEEATNEFLALPFLYFYPQSPATVRTLPSRYYGNIAPKATSLIDYNARPFEVLMAVDFSSAFEKNLPKAIQEELRKRGLLGKNLVDIVLNIQPLSSVGGNVNAGQKNITHLMAHGWADYDAPLDVMRPGSGVRVNREFLYGMFDSDVDLSHEVKLNELRSFIVHTHDGQFSPETAAIKLPSENTKTISFWTLVIDNNNPMAKSRALATLHWLISKDDINIFNQISFEEREITDFRNDKYIKNNAVKFATIGEYFQALKKSSFGTKSLMKKVESLLKYDFPSE